MTDASLAVFSILAYLPSATFGNWADIVAMVLLHFLWQGFVIAMLVRWGERRSSSAHGRYQWGVVGLLLMVVCPMVTAVLVASQANSKLATSEDQSAVHFVYDTSETLVDEGPADNQWPVGLETITTNDSSQPSIDASWARPLDTWVEQSSDNVTSHSEIDSTEAAREMQPVAHASPEPTVISSRPTWTQWIAFAWLMGVAVLGLRLVLGWFLLLRLQRGCVAANREITQLVSRLSAKMKVRTPRVGFSEQVVGALVVGLWRPMMVLPAAWVLEMSPSTMEAIIAHELAHLRRHDLWVLWVQRGLETLWFFHPAVWWLSARVRYHRECCCDDLAVQTIGQPVTYAKALEQVAVWSQGLRSPLLAAGISGKEKMMLLRRVEQVLGLAPKGQETEGGAWLFLSLLITGSLAASISLGGVPTAVGQEESHQAQEKAAEVIEEKAEKRRDKEVRESKGAKKQDKPLQQVQEEFQREVRELKLHIRELSEAGKHAEAEELEQQLRKKHDAHSQLHEAETRARAAAERAHAQAQELKEIAERERQHMLQKMGEHGHHGERVADLRRIELSRHLEELHRDLDQASKTLGANHPMIRERQQEIRRMEQALAETEVRQPPQFGGPDPRLVELQEQLNRAIKEGQPDRVMQWSDRIADHLRQQQRPDAPHPNAHDGPRHDGPRHEGPRHDGPRHDGPRHGGFGPGGFGPGVFGPAVFGPGGPGPGGPQHAGPRPEGPWHSFEAGPRHEQPARGGMNREFDEMKAMFRELRTEMEQMRRELEELRRERR